MRIGWSGETSPAWKSIECPIVPLFVRVTTNASPTFPRRTGPGTVPLKVHTRCLRPGATSLSTSTASSAMRCVVSALAGGTVASRAANDGPGSAESSAYVGWRGLREVPGIPPWSWPPPDAGVLPGEGEALPARSLPTATIVTVMPACRWPTTEHQPPMFPLTTPTSTVRLLPGSIIPVAAPLSTTRSCCWSLVLRTAICRRLPRGTSMREGVKASPLTAILTFVTSAPGSETAPPAWPPPPGEPPFPPQATATTNARAASAAPRLSRVRGMARGCPRGSRAGEAPASPERGETASVRGRPTGSPAFCSPAAFPGSCGAALFPAFRAGSPSAPSTRRLSDCRGPASGSGAPAVFCRRERTATRRRLAAAAITARVRAARCVRSERVRTATSMPPLMRNHRAAADGSTFSRVLRRRVGPPPMTTGRRKVSAPMTVCTAPAPMSMPYLT